MRFFVSLLQCVALARAASSPLQVDNLIRDEPKCPSGERIQQELRPLLSEKAAILLPTSPGWNQSRSSAPRINPVFLVSVEVATEEDVQATVKYANHANIPFIAMTGTHGWPTTLNELKGGIEINMRKLNTSKVNADGKTATVGGGTMQYEIVRSLYDQGKKLAVTGLCECVSVVGPLLGGGHSAVQGVYGFAGDNLVSARLVLANGTVVKVSAIDNPDLFWAIRGAGHNFGIVTSLDVKIHDASENWTMVVFSYTQDKLEAFFDTWNRLESEHENPGILVLNGLLARNPDLDPRHPLVNLQIFYPGENPVVSKYESAFLALGPVFNTTVPNIEYQHLYEVAGIDIAGPSCRKDNNLSGFPSSFARWDSAAMRAGFGMFSELTADERFATSAWILESYGRNGVAAVPAGENAIAPEERSLHLLNSPLLWWVGDDEAARKKAITYGERIRKAVRRDSSHAYVNYAVGGEELGDVYGRDGERLKRLRGLKKLYDPHNRFGYYMPIR